MCVGGDGDGTSFGDPCAQWGWGLSEPLFWREGGSQRGGLGFRGPGRRAGPPGRLPGAVLGQSLIACPRAEQGQSPASAECRPHLFPLCPALCPLLGARRPWCRPTCSLCVLREGQEQDAAAISTAELRCHLPGLLAWRLAVALRQPLGRGVQGAAPSPGPAGVEACGSSFFPLAWGRGERGWASLWPHLPAWERRATGWQLEGHWEW